MVDVQTNPGTDLTGLYQYLQQSVDPSQLPPVPQSGPYGAPAVERDTGPQTMNPMAVALAQGGMQPIAGQQGDMGAPPQQSPGFAAMLASALAGGTPSQGSRYNPQTGEFLPAGAYAAPTAQPMPAASAAPSGDTSQPIAGKVSDTEGEGEDAYTAGLRTMHDQAMRHYQDMVGRGDAALAAGNTDAAKLYFDQATKAGAVADQINMKALEHTQPNTTNKITEYEYGLQHPGFNAPAVAPRPITDEERATWGTPGQPLQGAYTISPGEAPKPISGSAAGSSEPLDQPSIDYLAARLSQGDNSALTGLGYSKVGAENRARVITRAAAMGTEQGKDANALASEQIANQVGLGGEKQGARTMGALGARINTFAEEAKQTGGEALNASADMPRDAWVPIENIIQMGQSAANNPKFVRLLAANNGFANTYAKAVNPSGIMTDEAKRQAFEILNVARSAEGYAAGVKQLTREANIVQNAVGAVRGQYGTPQGGTVSAPVGGPSGGGLPRVSSPDEARKLPSGSQFIDPSGVTRRVP